jgi:hypothetical protein
MTAMKAATGRPTPRPSSARYLPASGLRTGKIHVTKGSAAQILLKIGVTPADERVADKALTIAASGPKARTSKRIQPAATKKP